MPKRFIFAFVLLFALGGVALFLASKEQKSFDNAFESVTLNRLESASLLVAKVVEKSPEMLTEIREQFLTQNIDILVATQQLYPAEKSIKLFDLVLQNSSYSHALLELFDSLSEREVLHEKVDIKGIKYAIKQINTPRKTLIIAAKRDSDLENESKVAKEQLKSTHMAFMFLFFALFLIILALWFYSPKNSTDAKLKRVKTKSLNELSSRQIFFEELNKKTSPVLILLDFEDFYKINEFYGVVVGDFFLEESRKILQFYLPDQRFSLFRLGGDELGILADDIDEKEAVELANEIVAKFPKEAVFYEEFEISCSLVAGIARGREEIVDRAIKALNLAKKSSDKVVLFDHKMDEKQNFRNSIKWTKKIHNAIANEKIVPYFQPIVDSKNGEVAIYEALARIIEEDGKEVLPFEFLKTAKLSKQYAKLSRAVIKRCFADFSLRKDSVSINITIDDILNHETVLYISELISRYNLENRVVFEIKESELDKYFDKFEPFITDMREQNVRFAIDDFGSRSANFLNAIKLKIEFIKIGDKLVSSLLDSEENRTLVESIVAFARMHNIETIAEFVYNQELQDMTKKIGVDYLQGYQIAIPRRSIS